MMTKHRNSRKDAFSHIHGVPSEDSNDEIQLYRLIIKNLRTCENPTYDFHFNEPITKFGVPSKTVRIQDYRECFVAYLMGRSLVDREEAIELMHMIDTPVRTNTLKLDIGKTDRDGNLVVGLESNRSAHYVVPERYKDRGAFAKSVFNDMIKEIEISKIAGFLEVNHCIQHIYGTSSDENIEQALAVRDFVSNF
jgi:hypothetical protein